MMINLGFLLYKGHVGSFVRGLGHFVNFRERNKIVEKDALNYCREKILDLLGRL